VAEAVVAPEAVARTEVVAEHTAGVAVVEARIAEAEEAAVCTAVVVAEPDKRRLPSEEAFAVAEHTQKAAAWSVHRPASSHIADNHSQREEPRRRTWDISS